MSTPLDDTPLTLTLPAYAWAALRGAANRGVRYNSRRAERTTKVLPEGSANLDIHRASALELAAEQIDGLLKNGRP